jgi:hypothetical protein
MGKFLPVVILTPPVLEGIRGDANRLIIPLKPMVTVALNLSGWTTPTY